MLFATAQWHLQQCLDENFGQTDEATLTKYSHAALTARLRERDEDLTPQDPVLRFLPFASLCYQELASKYNDIGATDALHKLFAFEAAKKFTPSNVHPWISAVENSWAQVSAIATDPSYLAALQLLLGIKGCQNETWERWAGTYAYDMRDKQFTVGTLLERVRTAHALEDVTSKSPVAVVNYAHKQHTRSQPNAWDKGKTKSNIKKKQLRLCSQHGCTTPTPTRHMSLCKKHFAQSKNESDDTSSVADTAKDKVRTKSLLKAKKGLVKAANKVKGLQNALALAAAAEASIASPEVHATFTQPPSVLDDSASALITDPADAFIGPALPGDEASTIAMPKKKKKKRKLGEASSTPLLVKKGTSSKVKLSQLPGKNTLLGNTVSKKRKKASATVMHAVQDIDWSTMSIQQFSRPSHSD